MDNQQEINSLADLIPFQDSLKELWEEDRFRPVLRLLGAFYKENADFVLYAVVNGSKEQQIQLAVKSAIARTVGSLYNLPSVIKEAGEELERQKAHAAKLKDLAGVSGTQDHRGGQAVGMRFSNNDKGEVEGTQLTYQDTLEKVKKQLEHELQLAKQREGVTSDAN